VTVDEAATQIQALGSVPGRVFLVGDIVIEGETQDDVEIAVTDKQAIPQLQTLPFPTQFKVVDRNPFEQYVEVTPGQPIQPGGEQPTLEGLAGGTPAPTGSVPPA
jgi:hypothetical protein